MAQDLSYFGPNTIEVLPMQKTEEFKSRYYEPQEYLQGGRQSSCEEGLEKGELGNEEEKGGGLEEML